MRILLVVAAALVLAQCALGRDDDDEDRFQVGRAENALIIIGVAEASDSTQPRFSMLWRRVNPADNMFAEGGGRNSFEVETGSGGTVRVAGIPGEFAVLEVEPGLYALDSVYAVLRERNLNYFAQGLVRGPDRPAFSVSRGEAVYLGIWQARIDRASAATSVWRLDESDLRAVVRETNAVSGAVQVRETVTRPVPCAPHRPSNMSQRQVC